MNIDTHPTDIHREAAAAAPLGPFARIILASLAAGLVTALVLTLVVFAGHTVATITGAMLVGFGLGWTLIGVLFGRFTNRPRRWTAVPAVTMRGTGLGLVASTPGNGALTAMSWVWPAPMLA